MSDQPNQREKGTVAEDAAVEFLKTKGFTIVKRNFHFGRDGEIDIIARDKDVLVFVEVKARSNDMYGAPESSITPSKVKTIRRTAQGYLYVNKITNIECRFDVIAMDYSRNPPEIRHLVNAF
ncbi:MAG: YraN family protein [Ignavibacteria bacterium]|nr:YraN family protein [Ignavibacteria bacterium]